MPSELTSMFLASVKEICPRITQEAMEYLKNSLTLTELPPKDFYIRSGMVQKEIGFVVSGLLRSYYLDKSGEEITVGFIKENEYATDYPAFITLSKSNYYFQSLEKTLVLNLSYQSIQNAYEQFPDLERYGRLIAEEVLKTQQKRIEGFLFQTAEERYLDFTNENPGLFNRVSLSHLATFLGIQRPSLSRIRKRLADK